LKKSLTDLLESCTVRIDVGEYSGTGFFVAPGVILTCAHVAKPQPGKNPAIKVIYRKKVYKLEKISPKDIFTDDYPDLALLKVNIPRHPCVYLDGNFQVWDKFYSYGYTFNQPKGEGTTVNCEGIYDEEYRLIKLKEGEVQQGSSGSPLLNSRTERVCGMIQLSRDTESERGGFAFPIESIGLYFSKVIQNNKNFHKRDKRWVNAGSQAPVQYAPNVATLYKKTGVIYKADRLIGRDALLEKISTDLKVKYRVVAWGMGGIGKTAIAAEVADDYLHRKKNVIWLEAGYASADSMMEAIAECCNKKALLEKQAGDRRYIVLQEIIRESGAKLLVLDNMWNPTEVEKLLVGVPKRFSVLITSQHRFSIGGNIEIPELDEDAAVDLLGISSDGKDFSKDNDARQLCIQFGNHPYALEIAGRHIQENISPKELRDKLSLGVLDLSPLGIEKFRRRLLEESFSALDEFAQKVFRAFRNFSSHGVTSMLLAHYLRKPLGEVESAIYRLSSRSLVKKRSDTLSYYLHSLTYSYVTDFVKSRRDRNGAALAVKNYLQEYSRNFDLIALDLPSILTAVEDASPEILIQVMSYLVLGGFPTKGQDNYFDVRGHTTEMLTQLKNAIEAVDGLGKGYKKILPFLLSQYAVAMFDRGQYVSALDFFELSVKKTTDPSRKILLGSAAARTMAFAGLYKESKPVFQMLHRSAVKKKDQYLIGFVLEQKAWAAGQNKDYETARKVSLDLVKLNEKQYMKLQDLENTEALFYALLNLGSATLDLAKKKKAKIMDAYSFHKRAWDLVKDQPGSRLDAQALEALGEDCALLRKRDEAVSYWQKAYIMFGDLGITEKQEEIKHLAHSFGLLSDLFPVKRSSK
jgi:hypothetical protein